MPCQSWSRARREDGGPKPLRDDYQYLWGKPNVDPKDLNKTLLGNQLLLVTISLIHGLWSLNIAWVLRTLGHHVVGWCAPCVTSSKQLDPPCDDLTIASTTCHAGSQPEFCLLAVICIPFSKPVKAALVDAVPLTKSIFLSLDKIHQENG